MPKCRGASRCGRVLRTVFIMVMVILTALFVATSSVIIGSLIVMNMMTVDDEGNVTSAPAPQAALAIVISVAALEVGVLCVAMRACRGSSGHNNDHLNPSTTEVEPSVPSAPPAPSTRRVGGLAYVYNSVVGNLRTAAAPQVASGDYTLLPGEAMDSSFHGAHGAEMVSMAPTVITQSPASSTQPHVTYTAYTSVPVPVSNTVYVPVSATPTGNVSMI